MSWVEQKVLVTGGSQGVGLELARHLRNAGASVAICARNADMLKAAANETGALPLVCDLSDEAQVAQLAHAAASALGGLTLLINNAAIQRNYAFLERSPAENAADIMREIATNLTGPAQLTAYALPFLREKGGAIVNVTSGLALAPKAAAPVYCATKAGLRTFTRALRYQLEDAKSPVTVHEAMLPLVDTAMTAGRGKGKISADAAARAILAGIAQGHPEIFVGQARFLPWLMRLAPSFAERRLRGETRPT